jgi:hypothetical protein
MYLIVTIDTEEDNWGDYSPTGQTLENIQRIPRLQELFDEYDVKPTYLITYPVATDPKSISILRKILDEGKCEIGTHCHPWNTPPFEEDRNKKNSMLNNLPAELQFNKIKNLHEVIRINFGIIPISFRGGRWGFNRDTALAIHKLGYKVDSSVTPYTSWTDDYGPDYSEISPRPYRINPDNIFEDSKNSNMIEIPATIGYLQNNFKLANSFLKIFEQGNNRFRFIGILSKLKLLNKVWLSPELSSSEEMISLAKIFMKKNIKFLNMTFHSNSLIAGKNPFIRSNEDGNDFLSRIKEFLLFSKEAEIKSIRLSEGADLV